MGCLFYHTSSNLDSHELTPLFISWLADTSMIKLPSVIRYHVHVGNWSQCLPLISHAGYCVPTRIDNV